MNAMYLDGRLFKNLFGTPEMRDVFEEEHFVERFMEVEAALARAEASVGLIPESAARTISRSATPDDLNLDQVESNVEEMHLFSVSIIDAWKDELGEPGEYLHWGATTQDISDTATVLQIREGLDIIEDDLEGIDGELKRLTEDHAETPMMGRTRHVQAIPITFGLKAATWLDEINRHRDRIKDLRGRILDLQFFGAVGTLSSLGEPGLAVQEALADELNLGVPNVAWFASRDRLGELVSTLAMTAATLGKISRAVLELNRDEVNEVKEPIPEGEVGSSTMPHKQNPVKSEEALMLSRLVRSHADTMFELMDGSDERDGSTWFAEMSIIPETFLFVSRLLQYVRETLSGLEINEQAMRENMNIHGGQICSEAVMMALAEELGRQEAHDILLEVNRTAHSGERTFEECLRDHPSVRENLTDEQIGELTDPHRYTGLSKQLAIRVLDHQKPNKNPG